MDLEIISTKCNTISGGDSWEIVDIFEGGLWEEELKLNFVEIDCDCGEGWSIYFYLCPGVDYCCVKGSLLCFCWGISLKLLLFGEWGVYIKE